MTEFNLKRIHILPIYPRTSKTYSDKEFVKIDNESEGGSHWVCFIVKDNKSFPFESFAGCPDEFLLNQIPKPTKYQKFDFQELRSELCGSYCLYFFYLMERMNYHDSVFRMYFGLINV